MRQLITLQEKEEDHLDESAKVAGDGICRKHNERLCVHNSTSEEGSRHRHVLPRSRRHKLSDEEKALMDAVHDLRALLRLLKRQKSLALPSTCVMYEKLGNGDFKECKPSDLEFPGEGDVHEDLFKLVWSLFVMKCVL